MPLQTIILDSFAILAWSRKEAGAFSVRDRLKDAQNNLVRLIFPLINFGEVLYITERTNGLEKAKELQAGLEELPIEILPATRARVLAAAHIKANYPISYADAFVVAAAQEFNATVLTGDPEFQAVKTLLQIEWLAQK
ncbi:MAG: type II toxin-antitoxin system VapC family toxin [Anaerolineales bacterium]